MDVLTKNFDYGVDQRSPVLDDFFRKVQYDESGNELVTYVPVDYPAIQKSFGTVSNWTLDALLKAGINPQFAISTGFNTRIEGVGVLEEFNAVADSLLVDINVDSNN